MTGDIAGAMGDMSKFVGEAYPMIKKLEEPFKAISSAAKVATSATRLIGFVEAGAGMTEGILATGGLLAGAMALTEVLAGPPGWILLLGTMLASAGAAYMGDEDARRQQRRQEKQAAANSPLKTFRMSGESADRYAANLTEAGRRIEVKQGTAYDWGGRMGKAGNDIIKEHGRNAFDPFVPVLAPVTDNTAMRTFSPELMKANEKEARAQTTFAQRNMDTQFRLMGAANRGGKEGFQQAYIEEMAAAKKYDFTHHTNTAREKEQAGMLTFYQLGYERNKGKAAPVEAYLPQKREIQRGTGAQAASRSISINLNAPMIGSFSIHTQSADNAIKDFKRKVEDVLLEILYSANAI